MHSGASSVTITGVTYSVAETITLTATPTNGMTTLTNATSTAFPILAAAPDHLVFLSYPTLGSQNVPFNAQVGVLDAHGNAWPVTNNTTITLSVATGSGSLTTGNTNGIMYSGTNSVTIANVIYNGADTLTLTATATAGMTSLTPATSGNIPFRAYVNEPLLWATNRSAWDWTSYNWVDSTIPTGVPSTYMDGDNVVFEDTQSRRPSDHRYFDQREQAEHCDGQHRKLLRDQGRRHQRLHRTDQAGLRHPDVGRDQHLRRDHGAGGRQTGGDQRAPRWGPARSRSTPPPLPWNSITTPTWPSARTRPSRPT